MLDLYIPQNSPIDELDARVKLLFALTLIFFLNLAPAAAWPAYVLFLTVIWAAALLSRIPAKILLLRSFVFLPFVVAALPILFVGTDRRLLSLGVIDLLYSPAGAIRFFSIAIKSWLSVQTAILLTATTKAPDLFIALRQLGIPKEFVWIARFTWRYLALMTNEAARLLRARASRSAGPESGQGGAGLVWRAKVTGGIAGNLLLRSFDRSERVYQAMLSRGFNGELPASRASSLTREDGLIILFAMLVFAFVCALAWFFEGMT